MVRTLRGIYKWGRGEGGRVERRKGGREGGREIGREGGREGGRKACVISLVEVLILKTRNGRNKMRWNGIKWNAISTYKNR